MYKCKNRKKKEINHKDQFLKDQESMFHWTHPWAIIKNRGFLVKKGIRMILRVQIYLLLGTLFPKKVKKIPQTKLTSDQIDKISLDLLTSSLKKRKLKVNLEISRRRYWKIRKNYNKIKKLMKTSKWSITSKYTPIKFSQISLTFNTGLHSLRSNCRIS